MAYVKSNQAGIVLFSLIAIVLQLPWLLAALWVIQLTGVLSGGKGNVFVALARPFLQVEGKKTQAAVLTRFNNSLAVGFLTAALMCWAAGWLLGTYLFAGMLLGAAFLALCGYCVGCTMYYQFKQLRARIR